MILRKYFCRGQLIFGLLLMALQLSAQQSIVVNGKVTDSSGLPLPGVTVVEKNKDNRQVNGVITGLNGDYQIKISDEKNSLSFSFIGMIPVVKPVNDQLVIDVMLKEAVQELAGVEVIATATAKPRVDGGGFLSIAQRDQTAAVASISMSTLDQIPVASIDQVLEGQVSGLLINMNSGDPGSGSSIQIRGATSLGLGSKPLIVVDDVPFKTNEIVDVNNPEGLSELVNISPSDIATIDILKDAAATALYGSDGANGVIVIKTKRGDNIKPRVNITSTTTVRYPQRPIPLLNGDQYKTMMLEAYQNQKGTDFDLTTSPIGKLFLEPSALDYENYNNNTYWPDKINMIRGVGQNLTGSIIGGGEATKYNLSLGYLNETGPVLGTKFTRVTSRFNFDYKVSDKLTFLSDISYSSEKKTSTYSNVGSIALTKAPVLPVFTQDAFGNSLSTFFFPGTLGFQGGTYNPVSLIYNALTNNGANRLNGKVMVRYSPIKGLFFNSSISTEYEALTSDKFLPRSATGFDFYRENNILLKTLPTVNNASFIPLSSFQLYIKNDLTYTLKKDEHTLQALLTSIYQDNKTRSITLEGTNAPSEYLTSPYTTDIQNTISSSKSLSRKFSLAGQVYYLYNDRYSISGSVRRNGDSAFGRRNRYGIFPSVSGFWRPSSEAFMKDKYDWIEQLKFRGSWGISGRAPGYSAANAFTFSSNTSFIDIQGITSDNIELVNLRWEKTSQTNLGTDLAFLKGRISFTGDYSRSVTRDLYMSVPLSPSSGFESYYQNYGTIRGDVFEGALVVIPVRTKKWNFTASFNFSSVKSKILELPNNEPVIRDNVLDNGKFMTLINVGDATGTFYGLRYLGVYSRKEDAFAKDENGQFLLDLNGNKVPMRFNNLSGTIFTGGDANYDDINHDGLINKKDVVAIGNAIPKLFGGFLLRLKYDNAWELFANFTYQYNFDIINMAKMAASNMYTTNNQAVSVMRRWRKQGDVTDVPRALYGAGYNWVGSDRFIEDGSFLKCSTLSLAYNLKKPLLNKLKMNSAKLALTVYNAFIITNYSGVDPTVSAGSNDPFYIGRDNALTPSPITYTLGIWLNF
jgi:TonB-linked SusC/RagA family outer membrane protein